MIMKRGRNEMLETMNHFFYLQNEELIKTRATCSKVTSEKDIDEPDREIKKWTARKQIQAEKQR